MAMTRKEMLSVLHDCRRLAARDSGCGGVYDHIVRCIVWLEDDKNRNNGLGDEAGHRAGWLLE